MPAVAKYVLDQNSDDAKPIEKAYTAEIKQRQADIKTAWDYYDGKHKKPLRPDKSKVDDNVIVNLVGLLVEKGVSNLFGTDEVGEVEGLEFRVQGELTDDDETPGMAGDEMGEKNEMPPKPPSGMQTMVQGITAKLRGLFGGKPEEEPSDSEDFIEGFWKQNKKNLLLHDVGLNGSVAGHLFVQITPSPDPTAKPYPRLINLDPIKCTVFWDEDDMDRVLWYRVQYEGITDYRRNDYVRDEALGSVGTGWTIFEYTKDKKANNANWIQNKVTHWDYSWSPIVDWKNLPRPNEYYGRSDIAPLIPMNDSLNFVAGNFQRILKNHASPKTIGTGFSTKDMETVDTVGLMTVSSPDAKIYNLEMQSDLAASMNFINFIRAAIFAAGRELDPATVQDKIGALTNFGIRVLFKDAMGKNTTKRLNYGDALARICQYALELDGQPAGADIDVVWPDPLPTDPLPTAQALQIDVATGGLSKTTYLRRRGYDPDEEAKNNMEQDALDAHMSAMNGQTQANGMVETMGKLVNRIKGTSDMGSGGGQLPGITTRGGDSLPPPTATTVSPPFKAAGALDQTNRLP
jgi:hypothetical protein